MLKNSGITNPWLSFIRVTCSQTLRFPTGPWVANLNSVKNVLKKALSQKPLQYLSLLNVNSGNGKDFLIYHKCLGLPIRFRVNLPTGFPHSQFLTELVSSSCNVTFSAQKKKNSLKHLQVAGFDQPGSKHSSSSI